MKKLLFIIFFVLALFQATAHRAQAFKTSGVNSPDGTPYKIFDSLEEAKLYNCKGVYNQSVWWWHECRRVSAATDRNSFLSCFTESNNKVPDSYCEPALIPIPTATPTNVPTPAPTSVPIVLPTLPPPPTATPPVFDQKEITCSIRQVAQNKVVLKAENLPLGQEYHLALLDYQNRLFGANAYSYFEPTTSSVEEEITINSSWPWTLESHKAVYVMLKYKTGPPLCVVSPNQISGLNKQFLNYYQQCQSNEECRASIDICGARIKNQFITWEELDSCVQTAKGIVQMPKACSKDNQNCAGGVQNCINTLQINGRLDSFDTCIAPYVKTAPSPIKIPVVLSTPTPTQITPVPTQGIVPIVDRIHWDSYLRLVCEENIPCRENVRKFCLDSTLNDNSTLDGQNIFNACVRNQTAQTIVTENEKEITRLCTPQGGLDSKCYKKIKECYPAKTIRQCFDDYIKGIFPSPTSIAPKPSTAPVQTADLNIVCQQLNPSDEKGCVGYLSDCLKVVNNLQACVDKYKETGGVIPPSGLEIASPTDLSAAICQKTQGQINLDCNAGRQGILYYKVVPSDIGCFINYESNSYPNAQCNDSLSKGDAAKTLALIKENPHILVPEKLGAWIEIKCGKFAKGSQADVKKYATCQKAIMERAPRMRFQTQYQSFLEETDSTIQQLEQAQATVPTSQPQDIAKKPEPRPTPTKGPSVRPPKGILAVSINGNKDKTGQVFAPEEKVNIGAQLYSNIPGVIEPNNGCPQTARGIVFAIKKDNATIANPPSVLACQVIEQYKLPKIPGEYTLTADFTGEERLLSQAETDSITFSIAKGPTIKTSLLAHINGNHEAVLKENATHINLGARVFVGDDPQNCSIVPPLSFAFWKQHGTQRIPITIDKGSHSDFINCNSYQAPLDGAGTYFFQAVFKGTEGLTSSEDIVKLVVEDTPQQPTRTTITISPTTLGKTTPARKPYQTIGITALQNVQVAGVRVKKDTSTLIAQASNQDVSFATFPCAVPADNPNNTTAINEYITVSMIKILENGDSIPYEPASGMYANCPQVPETVTLNELSGVNRVAITACLPSDEDSDFAPSCGSAQVQVNQAQQPVARDPSVILESSPQNPTAYDIVIVTAYTSEPVNTPVFTITANNTTVEEPADNSNILCANGIGDCTYTTHIYAPTGTYDISFKLNNGQEAKTAFTTQQESPKQPDDSPAVGTPQRQLQKVVLYKQETNDSPYFEVPLPLDGEQVDIFLGGLPDQDASHTLFLRYEYDDGTIDQDYFTVQYQAATTPSYDNTPKDEQPKESITCIYDDGAPRSCNNGGIRLCKGTNEGNGCHYNPDVNPDCEETCNPEEEEANAPTQAPQSRLCIYDDGAPRSCSNGGTRTCFGTNEGEGCHYNPSIDPDCEETCNPVSEQPEEPQRQCDDVSYPDPNSTEEYPTGCVQRYSPSPYPNCSYIFVPVDYSFCE